MNMFRHITNIGEWREIIQCAPTSHPTFSVEWEEILEDTFPYLSFDHYVYNNTHAIRMARIRDRITTAPFSDGGDVIALDDVALSLEDITRDIHDTFGSFTLQLNDFFAPVSEDRESSLVDYRLDLKESDIMLDSFRDTLRHILQKDTPLSFGTATDGEMDRVYTLYVSTMRSVQNLALPFDVFMWLFWSQEHDVFVSRKDGKVVSFAVFLNTDDTCVYYLSGTSQRGREYDAPTHLLWYVLQYYRGEDKVQGFLGGTRRDSGLNVFKRGWRGDACSVYRLSDTEDESSTRTSSLRKLWSYIPAPLLPGLSKVVGKYTL